jgi:hypothetical protein
MTYSMGHDLTRRDPDRTEDRPTDASNIIVEALRDVHSESVYFGDECEVSHSAGKYTFAVPRAYVQVSLGRDSAPTAAWHVMKEAALALLAASRRAEVVWHEMQS